MINKKGQSGASVLVIYRVLLVSFIAFVILGLSSIFYSYEINARDSESMIFAKQIIDCVVPNGVLNVDSLDDNKNSLFSFCGFDDLEGERIFLSIIVSNETDEIGKFGDGDEGLRWVQEIYSSDLKTDSIKRYEPGYYNGVFKVRVLNGGLYGDANMRVEVIIKNDI